MAVASDFKRHRFRGEIDDHYDAIVVGAGIGGLVASALLARAGRRVLTLDQHYVPGGCVTEFRRKKWRFDVGLHYVGDCAPGGNARTILAACGVEDIVFRPMDDDLDIIVLPDLEFAIPSSRDAFRRRLVERFPSERRGVERYVKFVDQVDRVGRAEESQSKLKVALSLVRSWLLIRYAFGTIETFIDTCTSDPKLRAILMIHAGTHGCSPERVSAVLHAGTQNHYLKAGAYYPEGGGQHLSNRVAEELEAAGGQLRLRSRVKKILIENRRAVGVTFENKFLGERTVRAPIIISNADLKRTVLELAGRHHFPAELADRAEDLEMALPLFVVYLGLDIPPEQLPFGNSNLWVGNRLDMVGDYRKLYRGELAMPPTIFMTTKSLKDPGDTTAAPPGHSNLELVATVPRDLNFWQVSSEEIADGSYMRSEAYKAVKERVADACIDQAMSIIPDLRAHIVYREASTPMTLNRYVGSSDGTCYGLAAIPEQFLGKRPNSESGIPGLYFCGTNCREGHGVISSMGSAYNAVGGILGPDHFEAKLPSHVATTQQLRTRGATAN